MAEDLLRPTYYVDTEFAGSIMHEIAPLDSEGDIVLNIILDWEQEYSASVEGLNGSFVAVLVFSPGSGPSH